MDIGQPKRIIEIVPASLPVPGELEPSSPGIEPSSPEPDRVPGEPAEPAEPEPAERPA